MQSFNFHSLSYLFLIVKTCLNFNKDTNKIYGRGKHHGLENWDVPKFRFCSNDFITLVAKHTVSIR